MITLHRRNVEFEEPPDEKFGVFTSKSAIFLFGNMKETIKVWWHIPNSGNVLDWIGLFNSDDSSCYLDQKSLRRQDSPLFFTLSPKNLLHANHVYFGYIDGINGKMMARSDNLEICQRANFMVHEITRDLGSLKTRVWIETTDEDNRPRNVEITERIRKDLKLNFEWQEVSITCHSDSLQCPIQHVFNSHQLENDCSRSIDDRGSYRIEIIYSVQPIKESMELHEPSSAIPESNTLNSMPSTSSGMSTSSMSTSSSTSSGHQLKSSNWKLCLDAKGRVFYVNHETKETSWTNPEKNLPRRRAHNSQNPPPLMIGTPRVAKKSYDSEAFITPRRTIATNKSKNSPQDDALALSNFFQRSDFVGQLHENPKAMDIYNTSSVVRHALHRIQLGIDIPAKFESNPQFVDFVNSFSDVSEPLPKGWELLDNGSNGDNQTVFINHSKKVTSFLDPRVRKLQSKENQRGRSAPPRRLGPSKMDNNGNHLLINKYEEIMLIADQKLPHIADRIRKKLRLVERFGELAIASLANDLDLSLAVSMLDSEDENKNKKSKADENISNFLGCLQRAKYGKGPAKMTWKFSRENLIDDAFREILQIDIFSLRKSRLHVSFDDEIALDYGGPSREFFILLSRELFHPKNGYFEYYGTDYYLQLCSRECESPKSKKWLELCGRVLALALIHRCLIDVFFTTTFYKLILNQKVNLDDFETIDSEFYNSMRWILENDVENLDMRFVYSDVCGTQVTDIELLSDGENLKVTNLNKTEFVEMVCQRQAQKGIEKQSKIVSRAFHQILDTDIMSCLKCDELRMVLSGSMELDLIDWRMNTIYKGGYFDGHIVVEWFWELIERMSNFERFNLLLFVTGSSSVPFEGFVALRGNNGSNKFCIEKWGEEDSLPRAHTCFNRLQLPSYPTKQIMRSKINQAITNGMQYSIE